jgi:hypothetical protein
MRRIWTPLALAALCAATACTDGPASDESPPADVAETTPVAPPTLGPVDGFELARADLERVAVGDEAPDFSLMSYRGEVLTLSENRGVREILLVFYRGHW